MTVTANTTDRREITLTVDGMTCASCAVRVEKRLNRIDGVIATVNFATEQATVDFPDDVNPEDLVAAVEETGYTATLPMPADDSVPSEESDATASWRRRLVVSAALSVPVVLLSMVPALQFDYWQWLALALASPVAVWGAWPFHRAALANLRHRACDDGHAHLGRRGGGLPLVGLGADLHPRRQSGHEDDLQPPTEWR